MNDAEKARVSAALRDIESRHGCRVLFAVESGSRAWGFASPDSDYDVRGVFVKPLDWYLQLRSDVPDTIVEELPCDIDVSLWDLRKALLQMTKSNASFLEWLGSPIVYRDDGLIAALNSLKDGCFNHTYQNTCVILTGSVDCLEKDYPDSLPKSQITTNKLYVALTRTAGNLIRTVKFRTGLNVVWSPPTDNEPTADQRLSGHASGKTTLCRMIRYVLGEQKIGTENFRSAITHKYPEGVVVAEVRLDGETWSVARPFTAWTSAKGWARRGVELDAFLADPSDAGRSCIGQGVRV